MVRILAAVVVTAVAVASPMAAEARSRRVSVRGGTRAARYDESTDFSKHFDDEVKQARRRPAYEDGEPVRRKSSKHSKQPAGSESAG